MPIPTYDKLIQPLFIILAQHPDGVGFSKVRDQLAEVMAVSDLERKQLLPSGRYPVFANRVGWAHDRLKRVGLSHSVKRGTWCLTEEGKRFVNANGITLSLSQIEKIAKSSRDSTVATPQTIEATTGPDTNTSQQVSKAGQLGPNQPVQTPRDQIASAITEWNSSISADLLDYIRHSSPTFFEKLVLDLLLAMGYGANERSLTQTGGSGDGGIDGIITLDRLGLEKVYIQAKRYTTNSVGSPDIRNFYGALAERKASKGVFITSSAFSAAAKKTADRLSDNIVLIDGSQLARFMIEHEVGCTVKDVVKVVEVDTDYFDDLS